MRPILSLITGTRNRPKPLARLLDSVIAHTDVPFEMIVADASDSPYQGAIPENVTLIEERPRLGHSRGYNRCFKLANGEWIIWLNDDAEVTKGYASRAIEFMESHPKIGLGALHYSENGSPFHVNSSWGVIYANFGIFSRELGHAVGFFDEDIEMYGADNTLTFKILLEGLGVADIPDSRILHHSEQDAVRSANQVNRLRDNRTLERKYIPLKQQWLESFKRNQVNSGHVAWTHGREPVGAR